MPLIFSIVTLSASGREFGIWGMRWVGLRDMQLDF
jgi:hypothetical protein